MFEVPKKHWRNFQGSEDTEKSLAAKVELILLVNNINVITLIFVNKIQHKIFGKLSKPYINIPDLQLDPEFCSTKLSDFSNVEGYVETNADEEWTLVPKHYLKLERKSLRV